MPKGTIKNQTAIAADTSTTPLYNTGLIWKIEPEGDSNLNPPHEVRFISLLPVDIDDVVNFRHMIVFNKHVAVVYAKYTLAEPEPLEQMQQTE